MVTCHMYIQTHYVHSRTCTWTSRIQFSHLPFQYVVITPVWNILYVMWILWWCFEVCNSCRCIVLTLCLLTWTIWRAPTNVSKWRMGFNSAFKGLNMYHVIISVTLAYTSTLHVCLQLKYFLGIILFTELQVTENCNVCFKFRILFF